MSAWESMRSLISKALGFEKKSEEVDLSESDVGVASTPKQSMGELRDAHSVEAAKHDYPLGIHGWHVFEPEEIALLQRYGHWLEGLAEGRLEAYTEDQRRFVSVTKDKVEPTTPFEKAWMKLVWRREFERSDIPHYDVFDPKQKWFSDAGQGAMGKPYWR